MTECASQYSRGRGLVAVAGVEDSVAAVERALTAHPTSQQAQSLLVQTDQILALLKTRTGAAGLTRVSKALDAARDAMSFGESDLAMLELGDALRVLRTIED